uniref:Pancreatic progenitor cell differentiation and proliferation factor n=1 Tax=Spermophilus dauricus TaxID=99837 RepID=A0A8C9P6F4_SPEDA
VAAIPSSSSLVATHNYYWCRLCSTSSNSSCGSAKYPGEAIPHHPGLPKATPGHWWPSFLFRKSTLPFVATVLESQGTQNPPQAKTTLVLPQEMTGTRQETPSPSHSGLS